MSGETPTNSEHQPGGEGETPETPPAWFQKFEAETAARLTAFEGRFTKVGQDLGRLRHKVAGEEPGPDGEKPKAPGTGGRADFDPEAFKREMRASLKLEALTERLPEAAQKRIKAQAEAGASPELLLELAELAQELAPARDGAGNTPKGATATAAHRPAVPHPETPQAYREMIVAARGKDEAAKKRLADLHADPSFNPAKFMS